MSEPVTPMFDPRAVLAALQRAEVAFIVIGGLARVIRGADEVTAGVDICPSLLPANRERLQAAVDELKGRLVHGGSAPAGRPEDADRIVTFTTSAGPLKIVSRPDGVPRGYEALRPAATSEHLGSGLRPQVASTGDLITMAAAQGDPALRARVPELRRILELEASPAQVVETPAARYEMPGPSPEAPGPSL